MEDDDDAAAGAAAATRKSTTALHAESDATRPSAELDALVGGSGSDSGSSEQAAPALAQARCVAALMLQTLVQGLSQGWVSPGLSKLENGDGPFVPTPAEATWIVSLFELGLLFGALLGAAVFARAGRRCTLGVAPLAQAVWVGLTLCARSAPYLYAARLLAGIAMGINFTFSSIYVGEVTTPLLRGALILVMTLLAPSGHLLAFAVGPSVSYWWQAVLPAPFVALSLIGYLHCAQETPYYRAMQGRPDDLIRELRRLRPGLADDEVVQEATEVEHMVREQQQTATSWRATFAAPGARRAAGVVLVLSGSPSLFGITTVLAYTQQIFVEADTPLSRPVSAMVVIAVKVAMILVAMPLIERVGRRPLLAATALVNGVAMAAMAGYFLAKEYLDCDVSGLRWLPLGALLAFMAATGGGVIPVSHVLIGELLSQRAKRLVAPLATCILSALSFAVTKSFMPLGQSVGFCAPFGLFALTNLFIVFFAIACVPETKGKTLAQVQAELSRGGGGTPTQGGARQQNLYFGLPPDV